MGNRIDLQTQLQTLLGSNHVYFQPPETIKMEYPAIVYEVSDVLTHHANDDTYMSKRRYSVQLITKDPDSTSVDDILNLPYASFDRHYVSDNLHHYTFDLYY